MLAADEHRSSKSPLKDGVDVRLSEGTHVGAVHLQIGDLQRSAEYYTRVLGLEVLERVDDRALPKGQSSVTCICMWATWPRRSASIMRRLGLDKTVWSYPGALFLSAGGYHHHLGTNIWSPGPSPKVDEAQLLEWELIVPTPDDAEAASHRLTSAGYAATRDSTGWHIADPWGTRLCVMQEQGA